MNGVTPRVFELNSLNPGMVRAGVGFAAWSPATPA
jgi:hypothetical protein